MSTLARIKELLAKRYVQIGFLVFLITILAFGMGYIIGRDGDKTPIIIEQNDSVK